MRPRQTNPFGLLESFTITLEAERKSAKTIESYTLSVRRLHEFALTDEVRDLTPELIRRWLIALAETSAESTVYTRYNGVKQFLAWCLAEDEIDTDPMDRINPPAVHEKHVQMLTKEQHADLLATCSGRSFAQVRDLAIIQLFSASGCRLSELVNMKPGDIDLRNRCAQVVGKGSRPRTIPFGKDAAIALDRYMRLRSKMRPEDPWLWLGSTGKGRLTTNGVQQMMRRRGQQIGAHVHPHMLRHAFADAWLTAGGEETDLMQLTGWKSRQMVARYASARRADRAMEAYKRLAPMDRD